MGNHKIEKDRIDIKKITVHKKYGYAHVSLYRDGKQYSPSVHSLVAAAFIGPRPEGFDIRHKNGKRIDNRVENLCYGTRSDNMMDAKQHGTVKNGERHHFVKIDQQIATNIISRYNDGERQRSLASEYGLTQQGVSDIIRGKSWSWLKRPSSRGQEY